MNRVEDEGLPQGFVEIPGYEGRYAISRDAIIYSYQNCRHRKERFLKQRKGRNYMEIMLYGIDGARKQVRVHRLLALTFLPNPDPVTYIWINHKNGNKLDNRLDNLEWCTPSQNRKHAFATGLQHISPKQLAERRTKAWAKKTRELGIRSAILKRKPVLRLSLEGKVVQRFDSISDAGRALNIPTGNITRVLKGRCRLAGGSTWAYAEKDDVLEK